MHSNGYKVEVGRSVSEVLALRADWQRLPLDPNADMDFYLAVVQSKAEVRRPHVFVLKQNGVVKSILVGRIEKRSLDVRLGYTNLASPPIRLLTLVHGGVLGEDSEEHASALVESVKKSLRDDEADVAWFHGLDSDSAFCHVARNAGGLFTRDYLPTQVQRWRIKLPATYQELYRQRSANTKHNLKRYSRRLRDTFGDRLTIRNFRDPSDLRTLIADTEAIARKTYHRGLGVGFVADDAMLQLATLAANQGWLRAHILYVEGKPCAFWNGFLYRRTFFAWTTGFDPDFSELRPGMFLLQRTLEDLCAERAADEVDFGFGDAQYKRDWCDHERLQESFFLFAPRLKGISLNCFRTPLAAASKIARQVLARAGVLQELKKSWRARLKRQDTRAGNNKWNPKI